MADGERRDYIDEERIVALENSVRFWGQVSTSPKATPATEGTVIRTANVFYAWLTHSLPKN